MSVASSTTSPQTWTGLRSGSRISSQTSSFFSTLPPLNTKQPLRLMSVTVAFSRESTPSQRAGRLTLARGANLLSFAISLSVPALRLCVFAGDFCRVGIPQRPKDAKGNSMCERAPTVAVVYVEIGARFPEFGKELLVECCLEITDAFGTAGAAFRANHAFNHLDVMRAPEREVLVVLHQSLGELILFVAFFEVREYLQHCA